MTFENKLSKIENALTSVEGLSVYHYWRFSVDPPYAIWQEDGDMGLDADNHKAEYGLTGAIEFFTLTEYDPICDGIQDALNAQENVMWYYDGATYEDETNLIHHSWRWRVF